MQAEDLTGTSNVSPDLGAAKKRCRRTGSSASEPGSSVDSGIKKPKQSKSRNGCITCKAKRLKCDERHPSCANCEKRHVSCGGYKKDFKWKAFEEPTTSSSKASTPSLSEGFPSWPSQEALLELESSSFATSHMPSDPGVYTTSTSAAQIPGLGMHESRLSSFQVSPIAHTQSLPYRRPQSQPDQPMSMSFTPSALSTPFLGFNSDIPFANSASISLRDEFSHVPVDQQSYSSTDGVDSSRSATSGQSPCVTELIIPNTIIHRGLTQSRDPSFSASASYNQSYALSPLGLNILGYGEVGELPKLHGPGAAGPSQSTRFNFGPLLTDPGRPTGAAWDHATTSCTAQDLKLHPESPEMLMARFDRETCGIMSIRNGPTENPWRNLIWPMAHRNSVVFEAIASMTCFHNAPKVPGLKIQGIKHTQNSVLSLSQSLPTIQTEVALAVTLALAFSGGWDQPISTGSDHIKASKQLIHRALAEHRTTPKKGDELKRLKFLCRTWIYIDVLSRLTCFDDDLSTDFDAITSVIAEPPHLPAEIDPLMGCATTLFPIIGHVANLVRTICKSDQDSSRFVPRALQYKTDLESWNPPPYFKDPEDHTLTVKDSLHTADAYRWATLLYLHQSVQGISTLGSMELAKRARGALASVPTTSRATIVHMYPLLAAGCEAETLRDREWVRARWRELGQRMSIGSVGKCAQVTEEIWKRRDAHFGRDTTVKSAIGSEDRFKNMRLSDFEQWVESLEHDGLSPALSSGSRSMRVESPEHSKTVVPLQPAINCERAAYVDSRTTVKSKLHWAGLMREWQWEVFLG